MESRLFYQMNSPHDSPFDRSARLFAAVVFLGAGSFKLAANVSQLVAPGRLPDFAAFLQVLEVPFPHVVAWAVPLLEVVGAACLFTRRFERIAAALLACDMAVAIASVGVPGLLGRPVRLGLYAVGQEPWRLPLEIALLLACLRIATKRSRI